MTEMFAQAGTASPANPTRRTGRLILRGSLALAMGAATLGMMGGPASAADSPVGGITVSVAVLDGLTLSMVDTGIWLVGAPGADARDGLDYKVETNNPTGFTVAVHATSPTLVGSENSLNTIPMSVLKVRDEDGAYVDVSQEAVTVYRQSVESADGGEELITDFQMLIPVVMPDTYTGTLDYIASGLQ